MTQSNASLTNQGIASFLDTIFAHNNDKVALTIGKQTITYQGLTNLTFSLAHYFQELDIQRLLVIGTRSVPNYISMYASMLLETTYIPLSIFNIDFCKFVLKNAQPSHFLICPECANFGAELLINIVEDVYRNKITPLDSTLESSDLSITLTPTDTTPDTPTDTTITTSLTELVLLQKVFSQMTFICDQNTADTILNKLQQNTYFTEYCSNKDLCSIIRFKIISNFYCDSQGNNLLDSALTVPKIKAKCTDPNKIMHLMYTSGTTGNPKAVMVSYANYAWYFQQVCKIYNLTKDDVFANFSDFSSDMCLEDSFCAFFTGATLACPTSAERYNSAQFIIDNKITIIHSMPFMLSYMQRTKLIPKEPINHVRLCNFIGEPLWYKQLEFCHQIFPQAQLINTYGPTETTVAVSILEIEPESIADGVAHNAIVPLGDCWDGVEFLVCDDDFTPLAQGEKGELLIGGEQVTLGYLNNPEQNKKAFITLNGKRYYRTNDVVYFTVEPYKTNSSQVQRIFHYVGRNNDLIKRCGQRFSLFEVDAIFAKATKHKVFTLAFEDPNTFDSVLAVIIEQASITEAQQILKEANQNLPAFMHVDLIFTSEEFPLTNNGKFDRKALQKMYAPKVAEQLTKSAQAKKV